MSEARVIYDVPERFVVDDDQKALWVAKKIDKSKRELEQLKECYKQKIKQAEERYDENVKYFEGLLENYFSTLPEPMLHKTKTSTSYEVLGLKMVQKPDSKKYTVDDEALIKFIKNDPELAKKYIKVTEKPDWVGIKKISEDMLLDEFDIDTKEKTSKVYRVLTETGEVLPVNVEVTTEFKVTYEEKENEDD